MSSNISLELVYSVLDHGKDFIKYLIFIYISMQMQLLKKMVVAGAGVGGLVSMINVDVTCNMKVW